MNQLDRHETIEKMFLNIRSKEKSKKGKNVLNQEAIDKEK